MKIVQRGNKQLRVADDRVDEMLKAGFVEIDADTGKPISAEPVEEEGSKALKKENAALKKENKELLKQVTALTGDLKDLSDQVETLKAAAEQ